MLRPILPRCQAQMCRFGSWGTPFTRRPLFGLIVCPGVADTWKYAVRSREKFQWRMLGQKKKKTGCVYGVNRIVTISCTLMIVFE